MSRLKDSYAGCMECGGSMKMKSGGMMKKSYSSPTEKKANLAKTLSKLKKAVNGVEVGATDIKDPSKLASSSTSAVSMSTGNTKLVKGGTEKVAEYQRMLKEKGFNIAADGAWGKETQDAYEKFINPPIVEKSKSFVGPMKPTLDSLISKNKVIEPVITKKIDSLPKSNLKSDSVDTSNKSTPTQKKNMWADYVKNNSRNTRGKMLPTLSEEAFTDTRQLPTTGIVVDKGTNEAFVFGEDKKYSYPVLTGKNPDKNANKSLYSVSEINRLGDKTKVTPTGYYTMDANYVSSKGKETYKNLIRSLSPIKAYGKNAPEASNIAIHRTADPKYRNQFYSQGSEERRKSFGCVNGRCGDVSRTFKDVADKDTVLIIDSRFSKDKTLLDKAKARLGTRKPRMMMGGSIPGVNGSVIGPSVPTAKTGQSFPRRNAGTSKLAKFKKK